MIRTLQYIFAAAFLLLFSGCMEDDWPQLIQDDNNGELPVEFVFQWPGITETRGFDDAAVKTKFVDHDVIHIIGTFETEELMEDGTVKAGYTARYGALQYDAKTRQWLPVPGNKLTWPSISTKGKFYAYYLSQQQSTGLITEYDAPIKASLSDITPESDPLMAPETQYMAYGHAVKLQFQHLCSYLTLIDLEPMVASNYFFSTTGIGESGQEPFHNAFKLTLTHNTDSDIPDLVNTPQLVFEFDTEQNPEYNNSVFISGNAVLNQETDAEGEGKSVTKVGYFLEPGLYKTFELTYPSIAPNTYRYLSYDYDKIPTNVGGVDFENRKPDLEAGKTYTLTVTKSPGVTIELPPSGEGWDEDGPSEEIDVKEFLKAVREGTEYRNKEGTLILESMPDGTKLLKNVDFGSYNYENFNTELGFLPDVIQGRTFDGNYHYIHNLGCPLFRYNYGTITNLGIKNAKIDAVSLEYSYGDEVNSADRSRHGTVCMWNRPEGLISNVRVSDVDMTIHVEYNNSEDDGSEVHNIGAVVGSNTGRLSGIYLGDKFKVAVVNSTNSVDIENAEVLIGGVAGQNAGGGNISDVAMLTDDFTMTISNSCTGKLAMYNIGGIVGASSGYVSGVILSDITINSKGSSGVVSYIGGMAGNLVVTDDSSGSMTNCIVSGTVSAGTTKASEYIGGQAYTGGMVGYDDNVPVTGCRSSVSVSGAPSVSESVIYGTGGAFGRIVSPSVFNSLIAYGAMLQAPGGSNPTGSNYIGNFAGIGPVGQDWDSDYADKNIIFRSFNDLRPIGVFMSISN